jgi:acyl transferase domain-containing protein
MTIDTACSGSLVSVDVACQYLNARQADGMIVAGANIYLSPDHNMDMGAMRGASSATGKCHTFDAKADGYIKAEAVNAVYLKRLDDAIRDGDPIRAVIRGTSTNSDGRTPGIASPSSEAQAAAIRAAYENAGISDFNKTGYLECHGTGTLAGDPIEVAGAASVFGPTRNVDNPLLIGSVKSNIGHSEPAAGISGLLKAVLAVETAIIPGNPTFIDPNPKIEFEKLRVRASRSTVKWPNRYSFRRASVNSFGYGGSNAHVVLDSAEHIVDKSALTHISSYSQVGDDFFDLGEPVASKKPKILVTSANDEESLKKWIDLLSSHLLNPSVKVNLNDLAYTLSERRTRHYHRGFTITKNLQISKDSFVFGKKNTETPIVGFIFTGQGAQWSQMGRELIDTFSIAKQLVERLERALKSLSSPPDWSLVKELSESRSQEHLRQPEYSQPLVTALQLATLTVLESWGIKATSVVGHSSGEIAAAAAAGLVTYEDAIKIAYFRGLAAKAIPSAKKVGMLAVGASKDVVQLYLDGVEDEVAIACYNSPNSLTLSGAVSALERVKARLQSDGHFSRLLQVDLAYHSRYMDKIGGHYETLLLQNVAPPLKGSPITKMFSSVTGTQMEGPTDAKYWKSNMISPVLFEQATSELLSTTNAANFLIEIGPSNALAGPFGQIKASLPGEGSSIQYTSSAKRGPGTVLSLFNVAGLLFVAGGVVNLQKVNEDNGPTEAPAVIIDLPNYAWNRSKVHWKESEASREWRFRSFVHHDLLGTKVLSTPWHSPVWKKTLRLEDVPWLKDHKMGHEIVFPGAGYVAMAVEAIFQTLWSTSWEGREPVKYRYRLRDLKFPRALVLDENADRKITLALTPVARTTRSWFEYKVSSSNDGTWTEHSTGFIRIDTEFPDTIAPKSALEPLKYAKPGRLWYKAMQDAGYNFGPHFQKEVEIEATVGQFSNRALISLEPPPSKWDQSQYPIHPACLDGCFQSVAPSLWQGDRSSINAVLVPAVVDNITIYPKQQRSHQGLSVATSTYLGVGRVESKKNYSSSCAVFSPDDGSVLFELNGLRYHQLETRRDVYSAHTYTRIEFNPDITFLTQSDIQNLLLGFGRNEAIHEVIDLIAHKSPTLRVAEVNLDTDDATALWLNDNQIQKSSRAAYSAYHFLTNNPSALVALQEQHAAIGNATFSLLDLTKANISYSEKDFDLVIAKSRKLRGSLDVTIQNLVGLLANNGHLLFVENDHAYNSNERSGAHHNEISACLSKNGIKSIRKLFDAEGISESISNAYLAHIHIPSPPQRPAINLVRFVGNSSHVPLIKTAIEERGWTVSEHTHPFESLEPKSQVIVLDELVDDVLVSLNPKQWQSLQILIRKESNILWVTKGAQLEATSPSKAAVHGLFRVIRAEEPTIRLTTLDVESAASNTTTVAIDSILNRIFETTASTQVESEFVERHGILHVSRVVPDELVNKATSDDAEGRELQRTDLHRSQHIIRLRAERLGNIDSLEFGEVSLGPIPLKPNNVEVELYAAGLNFKDVAVTMGIVPENEHLLGLEGAGIITRVAPDVTSFKVGQRVVVFEKGTFANRIQATTERTHLLPDSMTFEEAATLPAVYLTSIYSLFYLANMKKGKNQRVLIHSASGGVGIASIQLAQYLGAEVSWVDALIPNFPPFDMQNLLTRPTDICHLRHPRQTTVPQGQLRHFGRPYIFLSKCRICTENS